MAGCAPCPTDEDDTEDRRGQGRAGAEEEDWNPPRSPRFLNGRPDAVHRPNGRPSLVELTGLERLDQTGTIAAFPPVMPSCRHAVINFALLRVDEKTARCGPRSLIAGAALS